MAAYLGKIEEYYPTKENWAEYEERLEYYLLANDITDGGKKKAVLITSVGSSNHSLLRSISAPQGLKDKSYSELVKLLRDHFSPAPSEIVQRFKFNSCGRKPGESVATFMANLRAASEHCNYGESLELMLRDRLVYGINDRVIQKRLLSESKLTYKRAVELAQELEAADRDIKLLQSTYKRDHADSEASHMGPVHRIAGTNWTTSRTCFRCGTVGHVATKCKFQRDVVCHGCGKVGHIKRACRSGNLSSPATSANKPIGTTRSNFKAVRQVRQDSEEESDDMVELMLQVKSNVSSSPIMTHLKIEDIVVPMEIDTSMSIISQKVLKELWPRRSLSATKVRLCNYNKEPIPLVGCCNVNIECKGQTSNVPLLVVEGSGPTLLGRNWLGHIPIDWTSINVVYSSSDSLQMLFDRHSKIFEKGLGTLKGFKATIHVDPNARPRFCRSRVVPYALREKVSAELDRLVQEGTLEPMDIADWAAPIVPVLKSDKTSVRICGDFRMTVNPVSKLDSYTIPKIEDLFAMLMKGKLFSKIDLSQAYQQLP